MTTMKTSPAGRAAIRLREGCKLTAYRDTKGIPTIGVGHVDATLPVTTMGMTITLAQADALLAADLGTFEAAILGAVHVPLSQGQFDALASLAFNIGAKAFKGSTVVRRLNAGDYAGAAEAFLMWNKPAELEARREAERAQFLAEGVVSQPSPSAIIKPSWFSWAGLKAAFGLAASKPIG